MNTKNFILFLIAQGLIFLLLLNEVSIYKTNSLNKELRDIRKNCDSINQKQRQSCEPCSQCIHPQPQDCLQKQESIRQQQRKKAQTYISQNCKQSEQSKDCIQECKTARSQQWSRVNKVMRELNRITGLAIEENIMIQIQS